MLLGKRKRGLKLSEFGIIRRVFVRVVYSLLIITVIGVFLPFARTQSEAEAIVDLTGEPTITMTSIKSSASVTIDPTTTGVFASTSGNDDIAFSVATTNYTGYTLSSRSTKTTLDKGTNSFNSLTSSVTAEQFSNSGNTTLNNRWGYKPSFYNSESNNKYFGISTSAVTLDHTLAANSIAKQYSISLGARADTSLPYGSYINANFILEAIANVVPTSNIVIEYDPGVSEIRIAGQTIADGDTVKLITGVPCVIEADIYPEFEFYDWDISGGQIEQEGQVYKITASANSGSTLIQTTFIGSNIQNLDKTLCTTTPMRVKDSRDGQIYVIQKLADDNCWMMDNLNIGAVTLSTDLTSENTNVTNTIEASTFNSWKKTSGTGTRTSAEFITIEGKDSTTKSKYGTLYNYCATSGGTICSTSTYGTATADLCPAGWRLPTGGANGEFQNLYTNGYDTLAEMRAPANQNGLAITYSGYFNDSTPLLKDTEGFIWAINPYNYNEMNSAHVSASEQNLAHHYYRQYGASIRCIMKKQISDLDYLQDFSRITDSDYKELLQTMPEGAQYQLEDEREQGKKYWISRLKDGQIWMTQNLDLNISSAITYTHASTDIKWGGDLRTSSWQPDNSTIDATANTSATISGWTQSNLYPNSVDVGNYYWNGLYYTSVENLYLAGDMGSEPIKWQKNTPFNINKEHGHVGNYYNFTAAIAQNDSSEYNYSTYENLNAAPQNSICPAGWRLPTMVKNNSTKSEYKRLYTLYGGSSGQLDAGLVSSPFYMSRVGYINTSSALAQSGKVAEFATSAAISNSINGVAQFSSTSANVEYTVVSNGRSYGTTIRCVARSTHDTSNVTIQYGEGVAAVMFGGVEYHNGDVVPAIKGVQYDVSAVMNDGYSFVSWSYTSGQIGKYNSQVTTYTPFSISGSITVNSEATKSAGVMQNLSSSSCTETVKLATDNRDNRAYKIQRLADGNCWMIENLDLGNTSLSVQLDSTNTNIEHTVSATTFNGWKKTSGSSSYTTGVYVQNNSTDPVAGSKYGMYYNYYAATAGYIYGSSNAEASRYDICPAGWRLPTTGSSKEFYNLYFNNYKNVNKMRAPINEGGLGIPFAGQIRTSSTPTNQDTEAWFWARATTDTMNSNLSYGPNFRFNANNTSYNTAVYRYYSISIRCVLKKQHQLTIKYGTGVSSVTVNGTTVADNGVVTVNEGDMVQIRMTPEVGREFSSWTKTSGTLGSSTQIETTYTVSTANATLTANTTAFSGPVIQNYSANDCSATATEAQDNRDGTIYKVMELNDGNCWIMESLDLGAMDLKTNLNSTNTNINSTITAAAFNSWRRRYSSSNYTSGEFISRYGTDSYASERFGTLYNYYAATGGTVSGTGVKPDAEYDICPAGWRMPTYTELSDLYSYYNTTTLLRSPIASGGAAFTTGSRFASDSGAGTGKTGYYWTSTATTTTNVVYSMTLSSSSVSIGETGYRYYGQSIRCILKKPKTISDLTYLQDFNNLSDEDATSVLSSMSYNTTYELTDSRDSRTYTIAKMKDGNIWMAENLDLGHTSLSAALTSANTNISTSIPAATFNGWITTSAVGTNDAGEVMAVSGTDATSGTAYGTLYNYYAASAGEVNGNSYSANANHDICPAGWRLPTGSIYGEVYNLYSISDYNSPTLFRTPITSGGAGFSLAGVAWSGAPEYTSYYASYWTSSMASDTLAFRASMNQSSVGADGSDNRSPLGSVRCIAKLSGKGITDYTRLQELRTLNNESKTKLLSSMTENTNYTLTDARDGASYTVAKLKDGNIWMTKNLDLGRTTLSENLNSVNTNMSNPNVPYATFNGWKKTSATGTYDAGEFINISGTDSTAGAAYGTLYNYYAASAGTISGSSNLNNATYDICPAGWRLPTGGTSGEFVTLSGYYTTATMHASIANGGAAFSFPGYFDTGTPTGTTDGGYWTSSANGTNSTFIMYISSSLLQTSTADGRNHGNAIRCVLK